MYLIFLSVILISAVTLIGSWYARKFRSPYGLIGMYVLFVTLSQITATKLVEYDLGFFTVEAPAAVLIFAVTFLMTDIVNEKFGRHAVHHMIFITWITQAVMVGFIYLVGELKPANFWTGQEAWDTLFGIVPRITLASWITFIVAENLDAYLFAVVRSITKGKHIWARNVFSSGIAIIADTLLFCTLAFAGSKLPDGSDFPLWTVIKGQFAIKYLVCLFDIPFMYLNRSVLGPRLADEKSENIFP